MKRNHSHSGKTAAGPLAGLLLLFLLSLNGCLVGAMLFGGAAALVIKEGFIAEDTYSGDIKTTSAKAFDAAADVMDELCHKIEMEKVFRKISGSWKGVSLEVSIKDKGGGEVSMAVKARKYMLADRDTAVDVFQRILRRIKS